MAHSEAYRQFRDSQQMNHEKWHDGVGYDLDAFAAMTPDERDAVAAEALANPRPDWRDLEVLGAHRSRESLERLRHLLVDAPVGDRA